MTSSPRSHESFLELELICQHSHSNITTLPNNTTTTLPPKLPVIWNTLKPLNPRWTHTFWLQNGQSWPMWSVGEKNLFPGELFPSAHRPKFRRKPEDFPRAFLNAKLKQTEIIRNRSTSEPQIVLKFLEPGVRLYGAIIPRGVWLIPRGFESHNLSWSVGLRLHSSAASRQLRRDHLHRCLRAEVYWEEHHNWNSWAGIFWMFLDLGLNMHWKDFFINPLVDTIFRIWPLVGFLRKPLTKCRNVKSSLDQHHGTGGCETIKK